MQHFGRCEWAGQVPFVVTLALWKGCSIVEGGMGGAGGRRRANLLVKALCVCVVSDLRSEFYFPYILLKRRLLPLSPLLICPTHSHFLMCFKRLIWWQNYIKPTGFLNAILANISTSLQVHRCLLPLWLGLCYELQAWDREVRLDPFPQSSGFQTTERLRVSSDCSGLLNEWSIFYLIKKMQSAQVCLTFSYFLCQGSM